VPRTRSADRERRGFVELQNGTGTLQREFYTADEIADYLGLAGCTIRELCRCGKLQHLKMGRLIRIKKVWADAFAESLTREALVLGVAILAIS
jgi:excisionase family DNA binding protein